MKKNETYKGFNVEYRKYVSGFNMWNVEITKYRFKGTKREEYFFKSFPTYEKNIKDAREMVKNYIDNIKVIRWKSQGLSRATYLPE